MIAPLSNTFYQTASSCTYHNKRYIIELNTVAFVLSGGIGYSSLHVVGIGQLSV